MRRVLWGMILLSLGLAVSASAASAALAAGSVGGVPMRVSPGRGGTHTKFVVRFSIPDATGASGNADVWDTVSVRGPNRKGCVGQAEIPLRTAPALTAFRITLSPSHLNGHWCAGRFNGTLVERRSPICGPTPAPAQILCPLYVLAPGVIGRFRFRVTQPEQAAQNR
jgi:hypothetical protein